MGEGGSVVELGGQIYVRTGRGVFGGVFLGAWSCS